jgi:carboxypeptidase C (cathepsin A)
LTGLFNHSYAQQANSKSTAKDEKPSPANLVFNPDENVVTEHTTIKGQKISYKATTGTMPVWDEDGKAIAGLFYTYYERSDVKIVLHAH